MISCRCEDLKHLSGVAAQEYISSHLHELAADPEKWQVLYQCPTTGRLWKEFYPHSEAQGGGPPELTQISRQAAQEEFHLPG
jgi:hypothetical protein